MLNVVRKSRFKKDFKKLRSSGKDLQRLADAIRNLAQDEELPPHYRDHALTGNLTDFRECHLSPDWLLIYRKTDAELILVRTGSHSELFG